MAEKIYKLTENFPKVEIYGLTSQMRRSVVSIPSNIAEGQLRNSRKEFKHFISIALGSCAELDTQMELARRLEYIDQDEYRIASLALEEEMKILHGLRKRVKQ